MIQELIYTSAPRGLKPNSQGFCTVAATRGIAPNLVMRLESLSGYRHLYLPQDANAHLNPTNYSYLVLKLGGETLRILSRIADAGIDYSQRTNKIAHHYVLESGDLPQSGPSSILLAGNNFFNKWEKEPEVLASKSRLESVEANAGICQNWGRWTGDAGWGGVLAETGLSGRPVCLIFQPGQNLLPLIHESLALLPVQKRWNIAFNTFHTKLPTGLDCQWKGILAGSPAMAETGSRPNMLVLDLTKPLPKLGQTSELIDAARRGPIVPAKPTAQTSPVPARATPTPQKKEKVKEEVFEASFDDLVVPVHVPSKQSGRGWERKGQSVAMISSQSERKSPLLWAGLLLLMSIFVLGGVGLGTGFFSGMIAKIQSGKPGEDTKKPDSGSTVEQTEQEATAVEEAETAKSQDPPTETEQQPQEEAVVEETPQKEAVVEETPQKEAVVEETPQEEAVMEETPQKEAAEKKRQDAFDALPAELVLKLEWPAQAPGTSGMPNADSLKTANEEFKNQTEPKYTQLQQLTGVEKKILYFGGPAFTVEGNEIKRNAPPGLKTESSLVPFAQVDFSETGFVWEWTGTPEDHTEKACKPLCRTVIEYWLSDKPKEIKRIRFIPVTPTDPIKIGRITETKDQTKKQAGKQSNESGGDSVDSQPIHKLEIKPIAFSEKLKGLVTQNAGELQLFLESQEQKLDTSHCLSSITLSPEVNSQEEIQLKDNRTEIQPKERASIMRPIIQSDIKDKGPKAKLDKDLRGKDMDHAGIREYCEKAEENSKGDDPTQKQAMQNALKRDNEITDLLNEFNAISIGYEIYLEHPKEKDKDEKPKRLVLVRTKEK
ncbi:MAG: hypothetical protein ACRC10_08280 [Thermoguttaceae bacterium]